MHRRYQATDQSAYKHWYYLGAAVLIYVNWQLCTLIGIILVQRLPDVTTWGLDFAMSATFIGMVIPYLKTKPMIVAVVVTGMVALFTSTWPHKLGLMVAAAVGIATGVWCEQQLTRS
ncbi:MAG: hypothetical protein F6K19_39485 [Cyanothece sp. SIO1E1]|nr:hypothetical protein [Cyanothece sp. SIO1E1]